MSYQNQANLFSSGARRSFAPPGYGRRPLRGLGCGCSGLGADVEFSAASVWSDWQTGRACGTTTVDQAGVCAAATRAVNKIRYALSTLGYGTMVLNKPWGSADQASYKAWAVDAGSNSPYGMPLQADLQKMELQLKAGAVPGPETPTEYVEDPVTGHLIPGESSGLLAGGMSRTALIAIGVVGLLALGGGAYYVSKNRGKARGYAGTPALAGSKA
jgi:hypothetical protein